MVKRILLYIVLLNVIGIWAVLYESYEMTLVLGFLIMTPILFLVMLMISNKKLDVQHIIPKDKICKGESIPIVLNIKNGGIFPVVLMRITIECINEFYNVSTRETFEIPTLKRGKQSFTFSLKSMYCGNIKIVLKEIIIRDYFSLFSIKKNLDLEKTVPVIPDIKILECNVIPNNMYVSTEGDTYSKDKKGDDPSEVFDIREYHEGDELHSIHWKLSAKKDSYVVKELSLPLSNGIVIMLEMHTESANRYKHRLIDAIIDTVIAMSLKLQECGYYHYIAWYDIESETVKRLRVTENTHITEVVTNIYRSRIYSNGMKVISAYNAQYYEEMESHVYYISTIFNEENVENLKQGRENTFLNYISVITDENNIDEDFEKILEANDINLQIVSCNNLNNTIESLSF